MRRLWALVVLLVAVGACAEPGAPSDEELAENGYRFTCARYAELHPKVTGGEKPDAETRIDLDRLVDDGRSLAEVDPQRQDLAAALAEVQTAVQAEGTADAAGQKVLSLCDEAL